MFDRLKREFQPQRPKTNSFANTVDENTLKRQRMEGKCGDLAKAIDLMKGAPGVKRFLGTRDGEIGIFESDSKTFLKTGEFFRNEHIVSPTAKVADFKEVKVMSVNVGRFGEGSPNAKTQFMNFISNTFIPEGHILCLQDFRYDRDQDVI